MALPAPDALEVSQAFLSRFQPALDPGTGVVAPTAIASGRTNVGATGTSKVIQFGFPVENMTDLAAPNTRATIFTRVLAY